jgi:hypothetical protein
MLTAVDVELRVFPTRVGVNRPNPNPSLKGREFSPHAWG